MATDNKEFPKEIIKAENLNDNSFTFTDFNLDKDKRLKTYIHSTELIENPDLKNKNLIILTGPMITSYGFSEYQGKPSLTAKFQSNINDGQETADIFKSFCVELNEKMKSLFTENASKLLNTKEASKIKKNPKMLQAWINQIVKKDKNGVEEIKFSIRQDSKTKKINLPNFTVEKYKINTVNGKKSKEVIEKKKIDLMKCENQFNVLREHIKPGSHVQALVNPSLYWYKNKFGISLGIEALCVLKANSTTVDNNAIDLSSSSISFSPPKKNKDGVGYSALVLNSETGGLSGKILTGSLKLPYGISEYENTPGSFDQSIVLMNQSDDDCADSNNKFFEYSEGLNDAALEYAEEHRDTIFKKPDDDEELTRDIIESAYFNPCLTQNKNGDDQIKLKIIKDEDGIPVFKCFEYDDFNDESSKKEVNWEEMDDVTSDIKNIIRGGSHVKAIVQPRIYFIANKIGVNYRLIELQVLKRNYIRKDFNNVFSFSDDVEVSNTNDSEVTIEEEEEEIEEEEEVDSDAYGEEGDEGSDEEIHEVSA